LRLGYAVWRLPVRDYTGSKAGRVTKSWSGASFTHVRYYVVVRTLVAAAIVLLYILHQDFWFWAEARPLIFGFLPVGLFYHAVYTLAASLLMWLLVKLAWPSHLEAHEDDGH
jgi:hypothetical protein